MNADSHLVGDALPFGSQDFHALTEYSRELRDQRCGLASLQARRAG